MNSFIVKICGITCEEDARVAVDAGANALGFNFYRNSPRYIEPESAAQIIHRVPGDYLKVGIFVVERAFSLPRLPSGRPFPLDVLQLYGEIHTPELPRDCRIWRALPASAAPQKQNDFEALLLDSSAPGYGGSGQTFDWSLARALPQRVIVAGGLDGSNVAEAVRTARPWGVDACSRLEFAPGRKDPRRVRDFVQAALAALRVAEGMTL
ncbi:MAG TPA: phosphoribosylanthranilate isomerase [Bryobacteraceae bacterium]|nr:phosphoribosylanthranilate isomerase [Bryobacteraceae bacterium]